MHAPVAGHRPVGVQLVRKTAEITFQIGASDLLLALHKQLDSRRNLPQKLLQNLQRLHVGVEIALVVRGAPGVHIPVPDFRPKGIGRPLVQRIGVLHVIMVVDEQLLFLPLFRTSGKYRRESPLHL